MVKTSEMSMELKQELAFTKEELAELEAAKKKLDAAKAALTAMETSYGYTGTYTRHHRRAELGSGGPLPV